MNPLVPFIYARIPGIILQAAIALDLRAPWNVAACAGVLCACWICGQHAKTGIIFIDYSIGMEFAITAMDAIHLTLLVRPLHVFRQLKQTESADKLSFFERFTWAADLCGSPRAIGWHHQVKLPEETTKSRKEFVLARLMRAAKHYVFFDLGLFYMKHNPVFKSPAAFASQTNFVHRFLGCFVYVGTNYCMVNVVHALIVAVVVSCTSAETSSWPNIFGKWEDTYTIRRFWGRTWQQFLRRFLAPFGKKMASLLGFKPGTSGSAYTQLFTGFFVSAITHAGGDAMTNPSRIGVSCPFFIYQAFVITFEDMVIIAAQRAGIKETKWTRVLGYVWVASWFIVTATQWNTVISVAGVENGGLLIPLQYFPPSLCDILFKLSV
ncbi:hypothetical protein AZE42_04222 [Rhizopogon vesiculosus]|uniref:Wax synthase domain-containing protein n=1 Tax=Rhizopogon vesiculosus TaxID=180088 RepID=A0A1J8QE58_9AGAM|nr:hypothetical protein AZE42_04222 [Rhizopogon vesiculosus]